MHGSGVYTWASGEKWVQCSNIYKYISSRVLRSVMGKAR
jgi:hypothetical protein